VSFIFRTSIKIGVAISAVYLFFSIFDLFYQRWRYQKGLRMTKQEVKDEQKRAEGNEAVKKKIKQIMYASAQSGAVSALKNADLLVLDRDKRMVALKFDPKLIAPICVCKAIGQRAKLLQNQGIHRKIPWIDRPDLAKSLYQASEAGQHIPSSLYSEVAKAYAALSAEAAKNIPKHSKIND
jgi:flagellar biosynthetic protein FlhB